MFKLLLKLLIVGLLVYIILDYFYPDKSLEQLSEEASSKVKQTMNRVDSIGRSAYTAVKYRELDSLDKILEQINPTQLLEDSTRIKWEEALSNAKLHKQQLNEKILELDTVAGERYDQLKNKIELGIRLLEEELEQLRK